MYRTRTLSGKSSCERQEHCQEQHVMKGDRPNPPGQNPAALAYVIALFFATVRGSVRVRTPVSWVGYG